VAQEFPDNPLLLSRRLPHPPGAADPAADHEMADPAAPLRLALAAEERTRLRGLRHSLCGQPLLLQLPRGEALRPGEWLAPEGGGPLVRVEAAPEPLLVVRAPSPLALLQAAYHLGNRHVALEVRATELRLSDDPVLAHLLEHRGLVVERCREPFQPEGGAYAGGSAPHAHGHGHDQGHGHSHLPLQGEAR
jgi:urease accessory protein